MFPVDAGGVCGTMEKCVGILVKIFYRFREPCIGSQDNHDFIRGTPAWQKNKTIHTETLVLQDSWRKQPGV